MNKVGLILAAGDATRMPNKAILPIKRDLIAIESSINLLRLSCIKDVYIVIKPGSIIPSILPKRFSGHQTFKYIYQPDAHGYFSAIWTALQAINFDDNTAMCVTCCDNVYHEDERVNWSALTGPSIDAALSTRTFSLSIAKHLTRFDGMGAWTRHQIIDASNLTDANFKDEYLCFAGYALFKNLKNLQKMLVTALGYGGSTEVILNAIKAHALRFAPELEWFDIGTPETYKQYWESEHV